MNAVKQFKTWAAAAVATAALTTAGAWAQQPDNLIWDAESGYSQYSEWGAYHDVEGSTDPISTQAGNANFHNDFVAAGGKVILNGVADDPNNNLYPHAGVALAWENPAARKDISGLGDGVWVTYSLEYENGNYPPVYIGLNTVVDDESLEEHNIYKMQMGETYGDTIREFFRFSNFEQDPTPPSAAGWGKYVPLEEVLRNCAALQFAINTVGTVTLTIKKIEWDDAPPPPPLAVGDVIWDAKSGYHKYEKWQAYHDEEGSTVPVASTGNPNFHEDFVAAGGTVTLNGGEPGSDSWSGAGVDFAWETGVRTDISTWGVGVLVTYSLTSADNVPVYIKLATTVGEETLTGYDDHKMKMEPTGGETISEPFLFSEFKQGGGWGAIPLSLDEVLRQCAVLQFASAQAGTAVLTIEKIEWLLSPVVTYPSYTVTFDAGGGAVTPASGKTGEGGRLASLPEPTRSGYTFDGWYTAAAGGTQVTTSTVFSGDATIYAGWTLITYTVTFSAGENGAVAATVDGVAVTTGALVEHGKSVVFTAAPADDYKVSGWTLNGAAVSGNATNIYTLASVSAAAAVTVSFAQTTSIAASDRVVPQSKPEEEATVIAPVAALSGEFTAGPNPILKSSGIVNSARRGGNLPPAVNFFRQGKRISNCELRVYDATGNHIKTIEISDKALNSQAKRIVGSWDLTDRTGKTVSEGTYLVKGVIKTSDGNSEKVSVMLGVR